MAIDTSASTLVVTKIADTSDGVCDTDCSLREAVSVAASGDVVVFSPIFNSQRTITLTNGQIEIYQDLTISGPSSALLTVNGNSLSRIFQVYNHSTVSMSGMKLANGLINTATSCYGGAIYLLDSSLTLTNMILSSNTALCTFPGPPPISSGYGGAIYSINSTLAVFSSTISNNIAAFSNTGLGGGGGIYTSSGLVNLTNSNINSNASEGVSGEGTINAVNSIFNANAGAAIRGTGNGRISISGSVISSNREGGVSNSSSQAILLIDTSVFSNNESITSSSAAGGGINNKGTATISNSSINNNRVSARGGGIYNIGTMNLISSSITNNSGPQSGGGIFTALGQLFVTNSTVSGNSTIGSISSVGGGIYNLSDAANTGGNVTLTNSTITNNLSAGKGGGLRQDATGVVTFRNTIVAGNNSNSGEIDVSGTIISQGFNLVGNTNGSSGWQGSDLVNQNPSLAPLGNNGGLTLTHALMTTSPAINAGSNSLAKDPTTNVPLIQDQRGLPRYIGGGMGGLVDIGAYEANYSTSTVKIGGRVLTSTGRGIPIGRITLTDINGVVFFALTNPSGYYRFINLVPGMTYTLDVTHKYYRFESPLVVTVDNNRIDLNFLAQ